MNDSLGKVVLGMEVGCRERRVCIVVVVGVVGLLVHGLMGQDRIGCRPVVGRSDATFR